MGKQKIFDWIGEDPRVDFTGTDQIEIRNGEVVPHDEFFKTRYLKYSSKIIEIHGIIQSISF